MTALLGSTYLASMTLIFFKPCFSTVLIGIIYFAIHTCDTVCNCACYCWKSRHICWLLNFGSLTNSRAGQLVTTWRRLTLAWAKVQALRALFGVGPFEMPEEVGEVHSAEVCSPPYFALNASLCLVRLQVAEPFPNYQSDMTFLRCNFFVFGGNFLTLSFAPANFLLSSGTLPYKDGHRELLWVGQRTKKTVFLSFWRKKYQNGA